MASQSPIALSYEGGTVFYPRFRHASQWIFVLAGLPLLPGVLMVNLLPWWRAGYDLFASVCLGTGALVVVGFTLLYLRSATWLYLSETGMTFSLAFRRRSVRWCDVREVRLVMLEDGRFSAPAIEVIMKDDVPERSRRTWWGQVNRNWWLIHARTFGWSPDAILEAMKEWRAASVEP